MAHLLPLLLLLLVHFARLVTTNGANSSVRIKDAAHIHSFPFSLHRSTVITGTISTGQFNIHHANLEKSNTLDLLRIQVHLHNTTELLGISKPLLQVTCQHLSDFISFALPTKKGNMKDGVLLTGLDKDFLESHFDNHLHPPNFTRKLSGQKISAVMPIAFKVNISETPVQMLKISVRSNDDLCAFLVIQNYSNTFLNSLMIALKSSIHVTFTRKASLMLTTESPFHVLLMVQTDDRACNPAAPSREYDRVKKFDISFSNVKSSSLYPLIVMLFYCALAVILLASDHFMLLRLFRDRQAEADIPLIVFLDEDNSRASQIPSDQVISAASDFSNILVDNRTDEDEQNTVKSRTSVQIAAEHRAVDTDTNEITLHWARF
uniref:Legume lectin domain-containing protein n=1 Tax=Setaria digitata TaxID=48799 RepID=A0A915Q0W8_9BILA